MNFKKQINKHKNSQLLQLREITDNRETVKLKKLACLIEECLENFICLMDYSIEACVYPKNKRSFTVILTYECKEEALQLEQNMMTMIGYVNTSLNKKRSPYLKFIAVPKIANS